MVIKRLILVVLFLVILFGGIFGWKAYQARQAAAQAQQPQPPTTVASATVERRQWRTRLTAVGSLVAVQGIEVTTEVAGKVSDIAFDSGQRVAAGDVLVQLETGVDQAELRGLQAQQELARVQFERTSNLLEQNAISQSAYDEASAQYQAAQAQVAALQARIRKKTVRAPFDGVVGIRRVDIGQYVSPGESLATLMALKPIFVDYAMPERFLNDIEVGQPVEVTVDAYPGETFHGEIAAIDPGVNEGTRSIDIRARLPNPERRLRPGMFAEVATVEPEPHPVVTVPRTAISFNTYGNFVFVLDERDGQLVAQRRMVQTGGVRSDHIEITEGLKVGERVVRAGALKLRSGQPVQIDNSAGLEAEKVAER